MKKTLVLITALLTFALLFAGCGSDESQEVVNVYNWGENIDESIFDDFEEETGIKVNYKVYESNEQLYSVLKQGGVNYDVIIPSDYMIQRMVSENLLQPLDLEKIPNYANIDDRFKGEHVYYENGTAETYSIPYFYGMIGVIYNTNIVSEEDAADQSWSLMWNENYTRDILQFNNNRDAFGTAMYYLGYDVNNATEEQWREALELLKTQKPLIQGYVMDEIFNKMSSNSAAIAAYYAGDYLSMYEDNDALAFYYPKEGTNSYVDAMCIPANSENAELAMAYINFMCSTEIGVANAEYTYYASPLKTVRENAEYQEYMGEEAMDVLYGEQASSVPTQAYLNLTSDRLSLLNELWEELKVESKIGNGIYVMCGIILGTMTVLVTLHAIKKRRRAKYYD